MKQIHEEVQALEIDIGFWLPSWILLEKLKNKKKKLPGKFPGANIHILKIFRNNLSRIFYVGAETSCDGGGSGDSAKTINLNHYIVDGDLDI